MKPVDDKVIALLNDILARELIAINQYFLHAEMCENWGYRRLYGAVRKEAMDEMHHAEKLIERILHLEGLPNVQQLGKISIGQTVTEQLRADLDLELAAVSRLNDGIEICGSAGDNASRLLLEEILKSEEEHVDWLEAQIELIEQVGEQNYLSQQIRKDDGGS